MRNLLIILFLCISLFVQGQSAEMITNGTFDSSTGWTLGTGWTIGSGVGTFDGTAEGYAVSQTDANMVSSIEVSTEYIFDFIISDCSDSARLKITSSNGYEYTDLAIYRDGYRHFIFTTPSNIGAGGIAIEAYDTWGNSFSIDSVSMVKTDAVGASPYYVALAGHDGASGDIDHPFANVERGISQATYGDSVFIRAGVYYRRAGLGRIYNTWDEVTDPSTYFREPPEYAESGWDQHQEYLFIGGYPPDIANGDSVIFDFSRFPPQEPDYDKVDAGGSGTYNNGLSFAWMNYFHLKDFTIRNVRQTYRYVQTTGLNFYACNNWKLENVHWYNIGGIGFFTSDWYGIDSSYIINCDGYMCCDSFAINPYNYNLGNAGSWAQAFFTVQADPYGYMEINGCRAWQCADDGFNITGPNTNRTINSWSFANGIYLPYLDYTSPGSGWKLNNNSDTAKLNVDSTIVNHYVTNSLAVFNRSLGFNENHRGQQPTLNRNMYNNTAVGNEQGFVTMQVDLDGWTHRRNAYINNIGYANSFIDAAEWTRNYFEVDSTNSWTDPPNITLTDADFVGPLDSASLVEAMRAPRQADNSLPVFTNLNLVSTSEAINAGIAYDESGLAIGLPYNGIAPDLGYAEYGTGPDTIDVESITISAAGSATTIETNNGTLQMSAEVTPDTASFQSVTWSITNGTGEAAINSAGLVLAVSNGTVTVTATAQDGTDIDDDYVLTLSNQDDITTPTVTTSAILGNNTYYVTSGGNATSDGGGSITAKGICWNTTGNPTLSDKYTVDGTGTGLYTSTPLNLQPWTLYYIRAYATNSVGTSYGLNVQALPLFTTKPMKVSPSGSPIFRGGKVVTK